MSEPIDMKPLISGRRLRRVKVTSARWQKRAIFLAGGVAVALALMADWAQAAFSLLLEKWRYASLLVTPAGFALSVFITMRFFPNSQGSGIPQAIAARQLTDQAARGRLVATAFSAASSIPGGIFAPSLAVGAGLGANVAQLFADAPLAPIMLLGMVSYFAGVVQAPITAFVIVTEMTDNHAMVVPLMAAAVIAYASSRLICPEGIYHVLAKDFLQRENGALKKD